MVANTMTELCRWITELNYLGAASPTFEFYQESTTFKDTAETFKTVTGYLDVPVTEVYRQLQIRPPKDGEEVIGPGTLNTGDKNDFNACPSCGKVHTFDAASNQLDDLVARVDLTSQDIISKMVDSVKDLLDEVKTFEEFEDRLPELFGQLSDDDLAEQIEWATLLARLQGMDSA